MPGMAEIVPVFAVMASMYYVWSLVGFLYSLPGWLFYLTPGEIGGILAYEFTVNLVESLVTMVLLLAICACLPVRYLRDEFVVRGTLVAVVTIGSMMVFLYSALRDAALDNWVGVWMLVTLGVAILVAAVSTRVRVVRLAAGWVADRVIIFLFLFLPLSVVSMVYVVVRAIFI